MDKKRNKTARKWKDMRYKIEYLALRILIYVSRCLPSSLVRFFSVRLFCLVQFRKKTATANLSHVFPEMSALEREAICREMYKNLALTATESYLQSRQEVFSKMESEGWEEVEKVLSLGKGAIIASGHLGNFEMGGRYMGLSVPVMVIVKRQHNQYFDEYANKQRLLDNCFPIQAGGTYKPILKHLRKNGVVVMMTDQNARSQGYQLDFLGKPASTHISVAKIAIRTGVPVVIAGVSRSESGYPLLHFSKAIEIKDYENSLDSHIKLMQKINDEFGKMIRQYPSHWFWVHRRWRRPQIAHFLPSELSGTGD